MYGGRMTPCTPSGTMDRYTSGSNPGGVGGGGVGGTMERWTPPEMEISHCCRNFLMSRLRAAEQMNEQLSEDARNTNHSRLRSIRPPGEFNVDLAIEQLRAQVAGLLDADIGVIRQLLYVNEQMDELRWQRKYSPWTPSTLFSESCTADVDSVDYDPDLDTLNRQDDVTDDVFQNDETLPARHTPCVSSEVRFKVTPGGLKVNSPDKVNRSRVEVTLKDAKSVEGDSQTSKVEFRVNGKKEAVDSGKVMSSHAEVKVKGLDEINDRLKRTKVEFKVDGAKSVETKALSSQVEVRLFVNSDQGQSDGEGHTKGIAAIGSPCQTSADQHSQHATDASRDVRPSPGPIRKQRIPNEADVLLERRADLGPQLRILNAGQGIRMGHAGVTTPARVKVSPFTVATGDDVESETVIVHL